MSPSLRSTSRARHVFSPQADASPTDGLLVRADPAGARLLEHALRDLGAAEFLLPRLCAAWLWDDEIVVELVDAPTGLLPDRWRAGSDSRQWFLDRGSVASYDDTDTSGVPGFPCLVTIGTGTGLRLLLNLEAGPGLAVVTGPGRLRGALLGKIAAELATTQWSRQVRVTCVGLAGDLVSAFADRVRVLPDVAGLIAVLESEARRAARTAESGRGQEFDAGYGGSGAAGPEYDAVLTGWAPRTGHPGDLMGAPHVILVASEPSPSEAHRLARLAARGGAMGPRVLVGTARDDLPGTGYAIQIGRYGQVSAPLLGLAAAPHETPPRPDRAGRIEPAVRVAKPLSWSACPVPAGLGYGWTQRPGGLSRRRLTVVVPGEADQDVVVEADDAAPVRDVAEQLARLAGRRGPVDLFTGEGEQLAPDEALGRTPLRDGSRVFLDARPQSPGSRPATVPAQPDDAPGGELMASSAPEFAQFRDLYVTAAEGGTLGFERPRWAEASAEHPTGTVPADEAARRGTGLSGRRPRRAAQDPRITGRPVVEDPRFPGPDRLIAEAFGARTRLWERGPDHPDRLVLRLGLGLGRLRPATVALRDTPGDHLGIAADAGFRRGLAAWLVAQTVLLHPPSDVAVRVLTDQSGKQWWRFTRWLPPDGLVSRGMQQVRVSHDPAGHSRHLAEIALIIRERLRSGRGARSLWGDDALVVVLDDLSALHGPPWAEEVLRTGPEAGVYVVCLTEEGGQLPGWCRTRVIRDGNVAVLEAASGATAFTPDAIEPAWLEAVARMLAPLRDRSAGITAPDAPPERLLDLVDMAPPTRDGVLDRWAGTPRSAVAVLGSSAGSPFALDLRTDGPHALVAGMVGSGKDDLLCAWLASLALANRPDELNLLLVHHDNGESLGPAAQLPHTVGVQTGLDRYSAARGLAALTAELTRRQEQVKEAGARDFEQYGVIRESGVELPPLARLVVVVSDLAVLREELPEFVSGLVGAARRGPELGVHLVLATRRPAAALTEPDQLDLLAFAPLRVALRLAEAGDSELLIGTPAAARLDPSRAEFAYVRGAARALELVRLARWEAPRQGLGGPHGQPSSVRVHRIGWTGAQEASPAGRQDQASPGGPEFSALVRAMAEAAEALDLPVPHAPWPAPLPVSVQLSEALGRAADQAVGRDAPRPVRPRSGTRMPVVFGLLDRPDAQEYEQAAWDLGGDGHLFVSGGAGSGRTQLLLTLAVAVADQYSVQDVHFYALDCGAGALGPLTGMAHCGAVVDPRTEPERAHRLIDKLVSTVRSRQELLARMGFRSLHGYRRQQPDEERLPYLVLLVDGWESFLAWARQANNSSCLTGLTDLLRDSRAGVCVVLTGGEALPEDVQDTTVLVLRHTDPTQYERAGLRVDRLPPVLGPGRALYARSGTEVQIALPDVPMQETADRSRTRNTDVPLARQPFRILSDALIADRFSLGPEGRPVGRENVFAQLYAHYRDGTATALLGPRRAGKSWIVKALQERMRSDGMGNVQKVVTLSHQDREGTQDDLAVRLMPALANHPRPADRLLDLAAESAGASRLVLLLDEVGRLASYDPAAVAWLRDLGQAGAWLVHCGTDKDWVDATRHALKAPGSSFGNDVTRISLGPLAQADARTFLVGTARQEGVNIPHAAGDRILTEVGPWPFYLQVVGEALVRAARDSRLPALDSRNALRAFIEKELIVGRSDVFRSRWNEIGPAGRGALLSDPGSVPGDPTRAQRKDLRDVGLMVWSGGWLDDRPFFAWIRHWRLELADEQQEQYG
ncbi:FtsK/SpoIIIE domain-containing protein [Streptomyces sp. NPDC101234]|uniref:FtsK/SpoIIIE domain-containing protein n=1 Tax=Streptomyces sp. NPDC101234 TaxID=3366138 RepID=UPI0038260C4E